MAASRTRLISDELVAIIGDNEYVTKATDKPLVPLAQETEDVAAYIAIADVVPEVKRQGVSQGSYDRTAFVNIYVNVDHADHMHVFDVADSIERSILDDTPLWTYIIDRDVVNITFDDGQYLPKRIVTLTLEVTFKLSCT
jgi:hypothetical protein